MKSFITSRPGVYNYYKFIVVFLFSLGMIDLEFQIHVQMYIKIVYVS